MRYIYIFFAILCSSVFAQYPLKWEFGIGGHFDAVFKYQDGTFKDIATFFNGVLKI